MNELECLTLNHSLYRSSEASEKIVREFRDQVARGSDLSDIDTDEALFPNEKDAFISTSPTKMNHVITECSKHFPQLPLLEAETNPE